MNISKEQIEEVIRVINTHIGHYTEDIDSESAIAMLQGLLAQPEGELVEEFKFFNKMWQWKALKDGEVIYQYGEHVPALFKRSANLLPTTPVPFTPITEKDVTDEMLEHFIDNTPLTSKSLKRDFAAAVNAWGAKK